MKNHITLFRRAFRLTALVLISGLFAFTACFDDGGGGGDTPETYNSSLFVSKSEIGPGAECANGGVRIDMGFDANKNNVLDPEEVTNTEYVCHGEDASSHPFVVYTWPTPNESDVTRSAKVSVVFNTEMDPATVTESTLTLSDENGIPVGGTVDYDDITAVFTPDNRLAPDMKYTVTASPAMENALGTAMGYEHKVFFYTLGRYAVAYHANGATEGTVPGEKYYADGSGVNIAGNTGGLAKTGSPFMGWCTAPDGTGTCYDGGEPITISSADVDLYANWGYSISFNKNDDDATGTMDPQLMAAGAKENLNACGFLKTGWNFDGWSITPGGEVEYADGAEYAMGTGSVVLYAKWVEVMEWGTAELIESDMDSFDPQMAVDSSGNVTLVWNEFQDIHPNRSTIYAKRYITSSGWGAAEIIDMNETGNSYSQQLGVDSTGNVTVVWLQTGGSLTWSNIWAIRHIAGTGWGTAEIVDIHEDSNSGSPDLAVDSMGNVTVVWLRNEALPTLLNLWGKRYTAGTGWGTAELLETDDEGSVGNAHLVVDSSGNVMVTWSQSDGTRSNIWAKRYVAGTGWGTAELIETNNAGSAYAPRLEVDPSGNVTAVWQQSDGTRYNIWANRYIVGTGWGTAELIETNNAGHAHFPRLAVDPSGNVTAVWSQSDGTRYNIWANRYIVGTGWGIAELIETDDSGNAGYPYGTRLAVDYSGNVTVVWPQSDGTRDNVWTNRYTVGNGWSTAALIETANTGSAFSRDPQLAVDSLGKVTVVWTNFDGTRYNIWAKRFE